MSKKSPEWLTSMAYNRALENAAKYSQTHQGLFGKKDYCLDKLFQIEQGIDTTPRNQVLTVEVDETDPMAHYIAVGKSGIPIMQTHFFDRVSTSEYLTFGTPDRTLIDFVEVDIAKTATRIHEIYVPHGKEDEGVGDTLELAFDWIKENNRDEYGFIEYNTGKKPYPLYVLAHFQTVSFYSSFFDSKPQTDSRVNSLPVAFNPGTIDWDQDIRNLTIDMYDKLRRMPLQWGKIIDLNSQSSSLNLQRITEMFWLQGSVPEYKVYGADALTYELLKTYWLELSKRAAGSNG